MTDTQDLIHDYIAKLNTARDEIARLTEEMTIQATSNIRQLDTIAQQRDAALARLAELEKQEPKRPGWYQNPTDERWFECPDDAEILDSVFFDEAPKVGDEFELDVCWNGKQKFRVTKIEDAMSDDVEVEFISGSVLYSAAGASPVQPAKVQPNVWRAIDKYVEALGGDTSNVPAYGTARTDLIAAMLDVQPSQAEDLSVNELAELYKALPESTPERMLNQVARRYIAAIIKKQAT